MPGPPRVTVVTLGCGRNEVDSDQLEGLFHREGLTVVDDPGEADVVLVNTCTFIAPAKQESVDTVLEACQLKGEAGVGGVVVTGCMAERYPRELADAVPEADAVVGFAAYPRLPELVRDLAAGREVDRFGGAGAAPAGPTHPLLDGAPSRRLPVMAAPTDLAVAPGPAPPEAPPVERRPTAQDELDRMPASGPRFPVRAFNGERPWAYLKIASGCDRVCTFCAIPSFRGRFRSRPLDEIAAEAEWLAGRGARELVLVSENTTSWGKDTDGGRDLQPRLLERLAGVDGVERIRLMYLQPAELRRPLLEAMVGLPEVAPYFDLSLQHVSADVLRRMARSGSPERFRELVAEIRRLAPDAVLRSNFILGFPGETEEDVRALEDFLADVQLDWVGLFAFSPEDGTPSAGYPDQVPADVAHDRLERVASVQDHAADRAAARFVGRSLEVTVDEVVTGDGSTVEACLGRSYREAPETDGEVRLSTPAGQPADLPVGRTVTARVTATEGVDLVAVVDRGTAG